MMRGSLAGPLLGSFAAPSLAGGGVPALQGGGAARHGNAAGVDRNGEGPSPAGGHRQWTSDQLFGDRQEIEIVHGATVYRLRVTSLGKLILTK